MDTTFDVIVIGAGPAGETVAGRLAERSDRRVAIVERDLVGGECSFYACMPSKALLRPAEALAEVARVPGAAEALDGRSVDVQATLARRDQIVNGLDDANQVPWLQQRGITLLRGEGRLDGERRVRVGDAVYEAREAVVVAVGSTSLMPPIPGLREAEPWGNRQITTATRPPRHLIVLGGGVVGVEMAQAWRTLGSQVTVVEALDRLLPREEPFAGEQVADALRERGVDVRVGTRAAQVRRDGDATVVLLQDGASVAGDRLLVAVGRHPLSAEVGVDVVGLEPGRAVPTDDALRVRGHDWLYAVGDVNGRTLLTHMGKYQARLVADRIMGDAAACLEIDGPLSPRVIFTDPQVAAVGHTLAGALEAGIAARAVDLPTSATAGASFYGRNAPGTTRFVVDTENELLVGATFVGAEVADMVHAATIAIVGEVPLSRLVHAIPAFPTRSELWLKFLESYGL